MNVVDIAIGKSHTNSTVVGLGTIKGSPCVIKSTTKTATGNDVVFEWTSTTGTTETSTMKVKDGLNIIDVEVNSNNTITCTLSDGSTITSTNPIKVVNGKDGVNGNDGVSVTDIEVNVDNTITSTLSDGNKITSTNKITVKDGSDGKDGFSPSIVEDENNTNDVYKLKITTKESVFTTPNLKGKDGDGSSTIEISQETGNVLVEKSDGLYVPTTNVSKISAETDNQIKVKDDGIYVAPVDTSNFVEKEEGKELFSGKYEDLTGAPSIPSTDGLATETYVDTKIADLVNNAPETLNTLKEVADAIEHNESVVDALNESIGNKVDKVDGKGLSTNDFTDDVKESYDKAVTDSHTHDNKVALDSITSGKIAEWDNKSEFSGSYNDLTDVPTIPSADDIITQEELNAVLKDYAKETDIPITLPANGGDANTVNGHTVESDVPTDAKFTDTVYTHPTTSGNKHIPSGGSNGQILGWDSSGTASWKSNIIKASKTESDVTGSKIGFKYQSGTDSLDSNTFLGYSSNNTASNAISGYYSYMDYKGMRVGEAKNGSITQITADKTTVTNGYYYNGYSNLTGQSLYWAAYMKSAVGFKFSDGCIGAYSDNTITLGSADLRFKQLYAGTTTIATSDERKKENIKDISNAYKNIVLNAKPITFTFKNENEDECHDRVHCGFSAQDIKHLMDENGLDAKDFGAWCQTFIYNKKEVEHTVEVEDLESEPINGVYPTKTVTYTSIEDDKDSEPKEDILALRYEEFIPILTSVIQDLYKENTELKDRLQSLEDRLESAGI